MFRARAGTLVQLIAEQEGRRPLQKWLLSCGFASWG